MQLYRNRQVTIIVTAVFVFVLAVIARWAFYINPAHVDKLMFYGLGGNGDYDYLVRHSLRFTMLSDFLTFYWSLVWEYPVLIRLYAWFFNTFGFISGYQYLINSLIVGSALTTLLPLIVLSRKGILSIGGLLGSLLLAVNPLMVRLPSSFAVDTVTTLFYSVFVFLYLHCLQGGKRILLVLLGIIAFIDGLDRVLMIVNDLPALVLFAVLYCYFHAKKSVRFPYVIVKRSQIIYAVLPLLTYLLIYISWEIFYYTTFKLHWFLLNIFVEHGATVSTFAPEVSGSTVTTIEKILNYVINVYVTFALFDSVIFVPSMFLIAIATGLLVANKFQIFRKKYTSIFILLPVLFVGLVYIIAEYNKARPVFAFPMNASRIVNASADQYWNVLFLLEFLVITALVLGRKFIMPAAAIVTYFLMVTYGLYSFSERHFAQILLIFSIVLGSCIDQLRSAISKRKIPLERYLFYILVGGFLACLVYQAGVSIKNLPKSIHDRQAQQHYLRSVNALLPENAILLSGPKENFLLTASTIQRPIIYNILHESLYVPYNKKTFAIPIASLCSLPNCPYNLVDRKMEFDFVAALNSDDDVEFGKQNFYVLDYDLKAWQQILTVQGLHPFIPVNRYRLEKIKSFDDGRSVYQLQRK